MHSCVASVEVAVESMVERQSASLWYDAEDQRTYSKASSSVLSEQCGLCIELSAMPAACACVVSSNAGYSLSIQ